MPRSGYKRSKNGNKKNTLQGETVDILIVENKENKLAYVEDYSDDIYDKLDKTAFVPPIFDVVYPYFEEQNELININKRKRVKEKSKAIKNKLS